MKTTLITMLAAGAITTAGLAVAQGHGGGGWHHGSPLDNMTQSLNLTSDQQAKVQPILDQAKPQLIAIHKDAMQKAKAVMDNAMAQIRPLLTADQQKTLDEKQQAREDVKSAMKRLHDVNSNSQ
jgi:Spy/CpxP family protein refolding chaperone